MPLVFGIGLLVFFTLWEGFTKYPMIPRYVFAQKVLTPEIQANDYRRLPLLPYSS